MKENISELVVIIGLAVLYFYWIKYELKQQFAQQLKQVEQNLETAALAVASESHGSKARAHFREAKALMQEIEEFDWRSAIEIDDLVALRRQLNLISHEVSCAIASAKSVAAKSTAKTQHAFLA